MDATQPDHVTVTGQPIMPLLTLGILTPPERERICNGCGPGGWKRHSWRWRIAKFLTPELGSACDRHDLAYWIGGDEHDRMMADINLLADIRTIATASPWYIAWLLHGEATVLFDIVRECGAAHFHHGDKRTYADLAKLD